MIARRSLLAEPDANSLDTFIARYMKAMNAPGVKLALPGVRGWLISPRSVFQTANRRTPTRDHLFHVGSSTKSYATSTACPQPSQMYIITESSSGMT